MSFRRKPLTNNTECRKIYSASDLLEACKQACHSEDQLENDKENVHPRAKITLRWKKAQWWTAGILLKTTKCIRRTEALLRERHMQHECTITWNAASTPVGGQTTEYVATSSSPARGTMSTLTAAQTSKATRQITEKN